MPNKSSLRNDELKCSQFGGMVYHSGKVKAGERSASSQSERKVKGGAQLTFFFSFSTLFSLGVETQACVMMSRTSTVSPPSEVKPLRKFINSPRSMPPG